MALEPQETEHVEAAPAEPVEVTYNTFEFPTYCPEHHFLAVSSPPHQHHHENSNFDISFESVEGNTHYVNDQLRGEITSTEMIDYFNRLCYCPEGGSFNLGPGSDVHCGS